MYIKGQKRKKEKIKIKIIIGSFRKMAHYVHPTLSCYIKKADPSKVCFLSYFG